MATVSVEVIENLKKQISEQGFVDVGKGAEEVFGVTERQLKTAIGVLKSDGYEFHSVTLPQKGTDDGVTVRILAPAGTTHEDVLAGFSENEKPKHAVIVSESEPAVEPVSEEQPAPVETESED